MKILEIDYYNNLHLYLLYKRNDNIYFYLIFHFIIFLLLILTNIFLKMTHFMPKLYTQDGTGRDSYIFFNNGGFYPPQSRFLFNKMSESCNILNAIIIGGYGSP